MQLKKGQIIELEIVALAFGGAGIGKYEGLTVFVPATMPGDKIKASFTKIKSNFAEAKIEEMIEAAKERVLPRCSYFGICGGCQLQFMPYEKQLKFKKQQVIDSFERIGKISDPPVKDVIGSENEYFYRNKMEFSFGYDAQMNFALGMHLPGRRYDILDLKECHLESEFSVKILNAVREFMINRKWLPYQFTYEKGFLKTLSIREGKRTNEMMVVLQTGEILPENYEKDLEDFVEMLLQLDGGEKKITSIYWSKVVSRRGSPRQIIEKLLYGKKALEEKMLLENGHELSFDILPQAFFQVNTQQAEILYSQVVNLALRNEHNLVFDLFCGTGTIGLFLAKHIEKVVGIELNESALKIAEENAKKNKIFNIDFLQGDVTKMVKNLRENPSLIVVDPPRAGLTEKLIENLNQFNSKRIIYVSCNPATLARDCQWFGEFGYKVKVIQPVDMFPHTFHIESVCLLER